MLFLCGVAAAEMKCVDIGAEHNMNIMMRENKIIISCQSHTDTLKVSPGNQHGLTVALWPSAPDFILIRGQPGITSQYNIQLLSNNYNIELKFQQKT